MAETAIKAESLVYKYGDLTAVNRISFCVAQGEILGFLGPNGAGKTTTIKMLTGQLTPASGSAWLLDQNITHQPEMVQARIGVCFEQTNLYEQMTAEENLKLFARLFKVRGFDARSLLQRIGLEGREKDRVDTYSKGMKQRLMVARALVNRPEILFLDEPTAGLDPVSAENIRSIILEEKKRGAAVFLTTHDMHDADLLSDRVAFINQGEIAALDSPYNLKQTYGKRALQAEIAGAGESVEKHEILMDQPETPDTVRELFRTKQVITLHSEEAGLEDIFIRLTGRGLSE